MIYTVAVQKRYRNLTSLFVKSLRGPGQYDGPIVIFTDGELPERNYKVPGQVEGELIVRRIEPFMKYNFTGDLCANNVFLTKISAGQSLLKETDRLAYFDVDTLAVKPVRELLDLRNRIPTKIFLTLDGGRDVPDAVYRSDAHRGFLTDEERAHPPIRNLLPISAGHFAGFTIILEMMFSVWEEIALSGLHRGDSKPHLLEQSALMAWAARNRDSWRIFEHHMIQCGYEGEIHPNAILVHLFHYGLPHMGPVFFGGSNGIRERGATA